MPNPGAFSGARLTFLKDQKQKYADALVSNTKAKCLLDIQRRYFKRFPITMPDDHEPDSEALASVDDSEPDVEFATPEEHQMSADDYADALKEFTKRQRNITFKKAVSTQVGNFPFLFTSCLNNTRHMTCLVSLYLPCADVVIFRFTLSFVLIPCSSCLSSANRQVVQLHL